MGMCHAIEEGVADYLDAKIDKTWLSPLNDVVKVYPWSRQSWSSHAVSLMIVKCNQVVTAQEETRMVEADVTINIICKAESSEFFESSDTDGGGECDELKFVTPFIRASEHARLIVQFGSEQVAKHLSGSSEELAALIQPYFPTYTGTEEAICVGTCPVFAINYIDIGDHDHSMQDAITQDEFNLTLKGYFEEYAL